MEPSVLLTFVRVDSEAQKEFMNLQYAENIRYLKTHPRAGELFQLAHSIMPNPEATLSVPPRISI